MSMSQKLKNKKKIESKFKNIDNRFLFVNTGFNFRPTEIQGAFGIHQIDKLEKLVKIRIRNAEYWNKELKKFLVPITVDETLVPIVVVADALAAVAAFVLIPVGFIEPVNVKLSPSVRFIYNPNPPGLLLNFISSYISVAPIGSSTPFKR